MTYARRKRRKAALLEARARKRRRARMNARRSRLVENRPVTGRATPRRATSGSLTATERRILEEERRIKRNLAHEGKAGSHKGSPKDFRNRFPSDFAPLSTTAFDIEPDEINEVTFGRFRDVDAFGHFREPLHEDELYEDEDFDADFDDVDFDDDFDVDDELLLDHDY